MAHTRRERLKQALLVLFVVLGVSLAVANWTIETGSGSEPVKSFYQPTPALLPTLPPTVVPTATPLGATPGPTATPFPTIED